MDEFDSDFNSDFSDDFQSTDWTVKDCVSYIQKSEKEIAKFKETYIEQKKSGKSLEEIATMSGWAMSPFENTSLDGIEIEFSIEPWTLINHPIYIVSRGLTEAIDFYLEELINLSKCNASNVWKCSRILKEVSRDILLAVNSIDLGEDAFANCHCKKTISKLNSVLSLIDSISADQSENSSQTKMNIYNSIFDLRSLCIDILSQPESD